MLITGANGFLAGWVSKDLISRGADLTALIYQRNPFSVFETEGLEKSCRVIYGDIVHNKSIERILRDHKIQTIFHLGAQPICKTALEDPMGTLEANIVGSINVLEAARRIDPSIHIVVASSDKAYGTQEVMPYKEDAALQGEFPYEVSKSCTDLISQMYARTYGMPIAIVRSGNFYGGGDSHFTRIFPRTIHRILNGLQPELLHDSIRDYVYVEDAVAAFRMIAERLDHGLTGEAFNLGWEKPISTYDVLRRIAHAMGRPDMEPIRKNGEQREILVQYLSAEKIKRMLGWEPKVTMEEGLPRVVAWYTDFFARNPNIPIRD